MIASLGDGDSSNSNVRVSSNIAPRLENRALQGVISLSGGVSSALKLNVSVLSDAWMLENRLLQDVVISSLLGDSLNFSSDNSCLDFEMDSVAASAVTRRETGGHCEACMGF